MQSSFNFGWSKSDFKTAVGSPIESGVAQVSFGSQPLVDVVAQRHRLL